MSWMPHVLEDSNTFRYMPNKTVRLCSFKLEASKRSFKSEIFVECLARAWQDSVGYLKNSIEEDPY